MVLISILDHSLSIVSVVKPFMGSQQIKKSTVTIPLEQSTTFDVDVWAMYLKKALAEAQLDQRALRVVDIVLAQRFLQYTRIDIPADIIDSSLESYIKTTLPSVVSSMKESDVFAYEIAANRGMRHANAYILSLETYHQLVTLLSLFDGTVGKIYPESPLLFSSFSHTLNRSKPEPALFIEYDASQSTGLLYDVDGLRSGEIMRFNSNELTKELKQVAKKEDRPARLIVGGALSTDMRQDSFTKEVGIWTNPLHRVIGGTTLTETAELYGMGNDLLDFLPSIVLLDMLRHESQILTLRIDKDAATPAVHLPKIKDPSSRSSGPIIGKILIILLIVIVTATVTYGGIWAVRNVSFSALIPKAPTPTIAPSPTPSPTPVPFVRENYTVSIQNGEGTPGLAGTYRSRLEKLGYTIGAVSNADEFTTKKTIIKTGNKQLFEQMSKDLKEYIKDPQFESNDATNAAELILGADSV